MRGRIRTSAPPKRTQAERDELVQKFRPLAMLVARKMYESQDFVRRLGTLDDVTQEAMIGLLKAAELYNPTHGSKATFMTYAYRSVHNWIYRQGQAAGLIRIPCHIRVVDWEGIPTAYVPQIPEKYNARQREEEESSVDHERVLAALAKLDGDERELVVLRFGLSGAEPLTMPEIGKVRGVSKEAVRQRLNKCFRKLARELARRHRKEAGDRMTPRLRSEVVRLAIVAACKRREKKSRKRVKDAEGQMQLAFHGD